MKLLFITTAHIKYDIMRYNAFAYMTIGYTVYERREFLLGLYATYTICAKQTHSVKRAKRSLG